MSHLGGHVSQSAHFGRQTSRGIPGGTRTPNLLLRRQMLYPVELQRHTFVCSLPVAIRTHNLTLVNLRLKCCTGV